MNREKAQMILQSYEWKSLVFMNFIYGMVSINELQRISLMELEFEERENIKNKDLKDCYDKQKISFEE